MRRTPLRLGTSRLRRRSLTKHRPSYLRPNKWTRISPADYSQLRMLVWEKQNHRCGVENCQRYVPFGLFELDHIVMRSHGGKDAEENVVGKCSRCHRKRHTG